MFRGADGRSYAVPFMLVCTLFFLWGFTNGMLDVLNKQFQNSLGLSKAASGLVQSANFIAYFVMALPAGYLAKRLGYKGGIIVGLVLVARGLLLVPARRPRSGRSAPSCSASSCSPRASPAWRPSPTRTAPCWARRAWPPPASTWRRP